MNCIISINYSKKERIKVLKKQKNTKNIMGEIGYGGFEILLFLILLF